MIHGASRPGKIKSSSASHQPAWVGGLQAAAALGLHDLRQGRQQVRLRQPAAGSGAAAGGAAGISPPPPPKRAGQRPACCATNLGQIKVGNFSRPVFVGQHVGGGEAAVQDGRRGGMQDQHARRGADRLCKGRRVGGACVGGAGRKREERVCGAPAAAPRRDCKQRKRSGGAPAPGAAPRAAPPAPRAPPSARRPRCPGGSTQ